MSPRLTDSISMPPKTSAEGGQMFVGPTRDGQAWGPTFGLYPPLSNYGLQMGRFENSSRQFGVSTAPDTSLWLYVTANQFIWNAPTALPAKYKAAGRVSVACIEQRCYVVYRGTNDGVYLIYTDDLETWTDAGRVGSQYAKSAVAPGMCAFQDATGAEKLIITGVGADKYIYYTFVDYDGKREMSWTKIDGTGTQSALAMVTLYSDFPILLHTAYNNKAFFWQSYDIDTKKWSSLTKVDAPQISSGVTAATAGNGLCVTYRGENDKLIARVNGPSFGGEVDTGKTMLYQTGMLSGPAYVSVSWAQAPSSDLVRPYKEPASMQDTVAVFSEKEMNEWDCKWQQEDKGNKAGALFKFFCC